MNKNFFSLCATMLVYTGIVAQEQQRDTTSLLQLDEVVVSDSRFRLKRENSGKTVVKITTSQLEKLQGKSIAEIINGISGIEIGGSRGREGAVLGVYARGGRGHQVLVVVDGVRISDPSSLSAGYDLRLLSTVNVASIEIIKGATSTLYGTNAATAVINITTKKSSVKEIATNFQTNMGTNQTSENQNYNISDFSNSVQISGTLNKFSYRLGFSNRFSDGLSAIITPENEKDAFSSISTDVRLGYQITDNLNLVIYGNQSKINSDFDESFGFVDAAYQFISENERLGIGSEYKYNNGLIHINAAFGKYNSEYKSAFPNTFKGKNYVADLYNKYNFNDKIYTILGLNYIQDETELEAIDKFTITDPYANVVYVSAFGLNLNIGLRLNNHSEYGTDFVYNFNPSYSFKTDKGYVKILSSYATSYITPSLTQLFGRFGANPELKPEDDRTIEGGLEYALDTKLRFSILYFTRKEENFVFYDKVVSGYLNAKNTIKAKGVEVELNWTPASDLSVYANYTFTERKGDNAIRIPKHKINTSLSYNFSERTNASLNYSLTAKSSDTDFGSSTDVNLSSFSLVDLYVGYELLPRKLKLLLNINNLFNESYTEVLYFTTKGRNIRIGLNLSF